MRRLLWAWTKTSRVIPDVALQENETHPGITTGISFREGARILYGPTMAVRYVLAGHVAVGMVRRGQDRLYIWEAVEHRENGLAVEEDEAFGAGAASGSEAAPGSSVASGNGAAPGSGAAPGTDTVATSCAVRPERPAESPAVGRWVGMFDPGKRRLYWGALDRQPLPAQALPDRPPGNGVEPVPVSDHLAEPHWSVYVGALLLAMDDAKNADVAEIWPLLQEEWRETGRLGTTAASRDALFVVNAFLWENRFLYAQDLSQVEPLPPSLPRHIHDRSEELVGRPVPFSWLAAPRMRPGLAADEGPSAQGGAAVGRSDIRVASPLTDGRYALAPDHPWPDDVRSLIPDYRPDEVRLPDFLLELADMIQKTRHSRRPLRNVLFYGPPGSGKSTLAQLLAQLLQLPYYAVNLSLNVEEDVLLGKYVPGPEPGRFRFDEPPFVQAFRHGGLVELMELNFARPGVLGAAHSALETPFRLTLANGETVERHPLCIVVATMNLAMVGTQRLNEALKSRFQRKIHVPPMPREELVEIVAAASGLEDRELIGRMADVVEKMQRRVEQEGLPGQVGTRELIDWAQDVRFTGDPVASAWKTVLPAAALEQRDIQEELAQVLVENVFGFAGDGTGDGDG